MFREGGNGKNATPLSRVLIRPKLILRAQTVGHTEEELRRFHEILDRDRRQKEIDQYVRRPPNAFPCDLDYLLEFGWKRHASTFVPLPDDFAYDGTQESQ